jgi:hypothetical protein
MKRRKPLPVYLSDAALRDVWRANHQARWHGTQGTVILLGRRTQRRITVLIAITEVDSPATRRAKERAARKARLVVVGQSRAVTEHLLRTTTRAISDRHATTFITPPVGHVFLLRHRLGPRVTFTATSFDGDAATHHDVHLITTRRR